VPQPLSRRSESIEIKGFVCLVDGSVIIGPPSFNLDVVSSMPPRLWRSAACLLGIFAAIMGEKLDHHRFNVSWSTSAHVQPDFFPVAIGNAISHIRNTPAYRITLLGYWAPWKSTDIQYTLLLACLRDHVAKSANQTK